MPTLVNPHMLTHMLACCCCPQYLALRDLLAEEGNGGQELPHDLAGEVGWCAMKAMLGRG